MGRKGKEKERKRRKERGRGRGGRGRRREARKSGDNGAKQRKEEESKQGAVARVFKKISSHWAQRRVRVPWYPNRMHISNEHGCHRIGRAPMYPGQCRGEGKREKKGKWKEEKEGKEKREAKDSF